MGTLPPEAWVSDDGYRTYYDVFTVRVDEPCGYKLVITPKCNCIGFTKTIILPIVSVLDSSGAFLHGSSALGSWRFAPRLELSGHFPGQGEYFILVGADNSAPGTIVGSTEFRVGGGTHFVGDLPTYDPGMEVSWPLESTPEGRYKIKLVRRKDH